MIPFFDEDAAREEGWRGSTVLTYHHEDVPSTPQAQTAMAEVLRAEAFLRKLQRRKESAHLQYTRRGVLNNRLRDLHRLMGNWKGYPLRWECLW